LQGTIPEEITKLETLRVLYLSRNALTGPIPSSLGMMPHLNYLGLQHNKLTGTVPTELGQLKHLSYLGLEKNDFTGSVDKSHPVCKLRALDADGNPTKTTTLMVFTTDCRGIEGVKPPEIECVCCTECSRY
jgi:Leucine-rich repeat (LRR) protein